MDHITFEAIITLAVIAVAIILFITEWLAVDVVAIGIMVTLVVTGVISAEDSIQGFSNNATLTVAAMFVLSSALIKTNILERISPIMTRILNKGYAYSVGALGILVGSLSAFVNNTPVVATFIPIVSASAKRAKMPPSRFLMPLSFVAMFGGACTLIGTSTNLLVSGISEEQGYGAFNMFLLTPIGVIFAIIGITYLIFFGKKLIPERSDINQVKSEKEVNQFIAEIRYDLSANEGHTIAWLLEAENLNVRILSIRSGENTTKDPEDSTILKHSDVLLISVSIKQLKQVLLSKRISIVSSAVKNKFRDKPKRILEIILLSKSELDRRKLTEINFEDKYNVNVIGVRRKGRRSLSKLNDVMLKSGDVLLIQTDEAGHQQLAEQQSSREANFLILHETFVGRVKKKQLYIALGTLLSVIVLASTGLIPIVISAFGGIVILSLTRVISMEEAYKSIDWQVIFLLAGALSLEKAMRQSGVSDMIGSYLVHHAGELYGPTIVLSLLYLLTTIITGIISNNAAAALLAPISITIAEGMQVSPLPFLVAIALAGSASFFTPVGYQTNTMVYSAGDYRFRDFLKVGVPLNLIFWIVASFLIPWMYPF